MSGMKWIKLGSPFTAWKRNSIAGEQHCKILSIENKDGDGNRPAIDMQELQSNE